MFVSAKEVMDATGYDNITTEQVRQAQFVIEIIIGRTESEVNKARDKNILARAVSAQTVYMMKNPDITFEQVRASSISRGDGITTFRDENSPFIAPLALMAIQGLSWKLSRSVRTGKLNQRGNPIDWRRD